MTNQRRKRSRAPRQRGRGRNNPRRQRGRGRIGDLFKKAGSKISKQIGKIIRSKKGRMIGKRALQSFVKAGSDIALKGANPKTTIKNTLKKTGSDIGRELVSEFIEKELRI